jgi:hypothetical protein
MKRATAVMTVITASNDDLYVFWGGFFFLSSRHSEGVLVPFLTFTRFLPSVSVRALRSG